MNPIRVIHFSDALCVWAYVSQVRMDELQTHFAGAVVVEYRYFQVFGDVLKKMEANWKDRGGLAGYSAHVKEVGAKFDHVTLDPQVWLRCTPRSSLPSHLLLCAVRLLEAQGVVAPGTQARTAWALRLAFFRDGHDIARHDVLLDIARQIELPVDKVRQHLADGGAHAALCGDLELAKTQGIQASPTLVFNEGRQRLSGNVGYRIMEANIRELLEGAPGQLSWC